MSEIIKNKLYLGSSLDANNEIEINERNIKCIICVAENLKINITNPNIKIFKYELKDDNNCNISLYFDEIGEIINNNFPVLVNCMAGISRSSTIVIAYIMKYYKINLKYAFLFVREQRNQICPNKKFVEYLFEYEKNLFGKNSMTYYEYIRLFYLQINN